MGRRGSQGTTPIFRVASRLPNYDSAKRRTCAADSERLARALQQSPPHSSLGPGIPKPLDPNVEQQTQRHRNSDDHRITKTPILNGLHHEYRLERIAA